MGFNPACAEADVATPRITMFAAGF